MSAPAFLAASDVVDLHQADVAALAAELAGHDAVSTTSRCFSWVRDEVQHSIDHRRRELTCSASEALRARTGFCYAKSHLLVALLRANGVASGFVYQRLTVEGASGPHCLHGLVGVFLPEHGLVRVDPRGNRAGIDARFEPPSEHLAFEVRHPGERLFPGVHAEPLPIIVAALRGHADVPSLLAALPDAEDLPPGDSA
jgi:transglutaminase-like putative cysteine protease